eukprot:CAMPEP_0117753950 /NCGR_PEP_ID=MMETSP0947-20121206/12545_1 /TAXON_ID=44440 /ORGANISM="Chattonella subsalsa, Strain CCMP2191" /LENGTH=1031 /DNA_ID=CAMNT_0005572959 /DNA_START=256 /DNA_END=3351 /DNA_ORIENTATION=+
MAPLTGIMSTLRAGAFRSSSSIAGALVASRLSMSTVVGNDAVAERQSIVHNKYDIMQEDFVKEYGALTTLYKHKKSGAEVLSVQIDDENKVFGITFRTPPEDDTGVPHILEHSVLCGSRKFPSKEPFVDLLKGSLQTFLNAFTYPDRTCYPVASQNTKDFYNLINVYLDAVLFPRAVNDPTVLQQEGWHFEAESPEAPLTYKGVVYNEMKGVYSSPDSLMARATQQALFPDNSYAVDSGGDPFAIPTLTFDYFKNFHARYYHPANSRVFFYGDDDPTARLDLLDEYLAEFDVPETPVQSKIEYQALKSEPWRITEKFPAGEENGDKHMIAVNWLMNDRPFTPKENLALTVLDHLLVGTSASTLRLAMDESGLGSSFIGGGIDDTLLQSTFSAGLKGVSPENVDKVEALVIDTLNKCAEEGFNAEAIEAAVNTIEFQLREFNTGAFPRGLSFMLGAMGSWIYDGNPTEEMHFEKPLQELKDDLAAGKPIFQDLLKTLLINNNHRLTVEMIPDTELEAKQIEQETSALEEIKKSMSESDVLKVIQDAETLKQLQAAEDSPEAKASLPKLSLEDLDKEGREIPIEVGEEAGIKVIKHAIPSNGILYTDVGVSLEGIDLEELVLLPLFSRLIRESGTSTMDRIALDESIGTHTGGIRSAFMVSQKYSAGGVVSNAKDVFGHLFFRGKSVANKSGKMFDLIHTMLTDAKLDNRQRVLEILRESKAQIEAGVITAGHQFAANRIDARYTTADYIQEITSGVSYVETLKQLLDQAENDWPTLQARLEKIKATLMKKDNILINLTGDDEVLEKTRASVSDFISKLPEDSATACAEWASAKLIVPENEGFVVPTQVNYVGLGGPLYKEGEKVDGSAEVVSRFLRTGYLWDNVRVMGGAYGGFCRFNPISGVFSFLSYRDPNLANTLSIYQNAGEYLASTDFDEATITQAIIGTIGDLDSPMGPDAKGFLSLRRYLNDQSAEDRQAKRDAILSTSAKDFKEFGERLKAFNADAKAAVITSAPALEKANEALPEKLAAKNVL